jgi:hypothetical protein
MQWLFYGASSLILLDLSLFSDINYAVLCLIGVTSIALAFKPSRKFLFASASRGFSVDKSGQPCLGDPKIKTTFFVDGCPDLSRLSVAGAKKAYATVSVAAFSLIFSTYWLVASSDPAAAQFLNNAQTWMTTNFGTAAGGPSDALFGLIFNALRGVFVIYLAISIIKVVAAARQDEDWQSLARTPMIILISITLGDVLAGLIIGNAP